MQKLFNHCVTCCLILGLVVLVMCSLFNKSLVALVAQDSPAYPFALKAFYWNRFYYLICPLYDFLFSFVLYMYSPVVSSASVLTKLGVNTALSIYLGRMTGIGGVTCATFIANLIGLLILCVYVVVKERGFNFRPYVNPRKIKELALLGLPESSFFLSVFILNAGINALALKYYSIQGVAVVSVLMNLYQIVAYQSEGISEYETVAINQALGEKNREDLKYGMRVTFRAVLIESVVFMLLFLIAAPQIVSIFDIDDPETAKIAIMTVRIMAVPAAAIIISRITAIFHQYTNKVSRAIFILVVFMGLVPLLFAFLLKGFSLEALVWGVALGPVISIALLWIFPFKSKRSAPVDLRRTTVVFGEEEMSS